MNQLTKTILIISIAILGAGLFVQPAYAAGLGVEFENGPFQPLFKETNFLPGEEITSWVKITNTSGATQRIATQPLYITDPNRLGDVLNLVIKEGGTTLYNNALSNFFAGGENYLSSLANGANTQYDFTVSFYTGAQNTFQGKSLGFDILIGFQGEEGGILPGAGSTSGGGGPPGSLPPGLTIQNETTTSTTENSVTIIWTTSYPATSQVIYALGSESHTLDLTDRTGAPPKYGYARTTLEYDAPANINGKISHSITISGLTPGTTYYYRAVSHGSLAITQEYSFTTLTLEEAAAMAMAEAVKVPSAGVSGIGEEGGETFLGGTKTQEGEEGEAPPEGKEDEGLLSKSKDFNNFAATFIGFLKSNPFYLLILFIVLLIVIILLVALNKKRSKI